MTVVFTRAVNVTFLTDVKIASRYNKIVNYVSRVLSRCLCPEGDDLTKSRPREYTSINTRSA